MSKVKSNSQDSFKKRYFFKLITNFVGFGISLITQGIVPRALGPASYGNLSFITNFFWSVAGFLNFNSSTAFYTKLSGRQNDKGLVGFYFYLTLLIGLILFFIVIAVSALGIKQFIWPGQNIIFITMGAGWAFLTFCIMILTDMSDAYALTVKSESINIILKIFGVLIILFLFWKKWFTLFNYFSYQIVFLILSSMLLIYMIRHNGYQALGYVRLNKSEIHSYFMEFSVFCLPLVVFISLSALMQIGDRWFLQNFSGSIKQGFYALAYQIGSVCFLFASAVMPLILREQSICFQQNDFNKMRDIFLRSSTMLYVISAFFCCFIAVQARNVLMIFGGQAYKEAFVPLVLMCFYPIHQTFGQINGTFFFATGRVKIYRNIGLCVVALGFLLTFFLLGPKKIGGLQAGAIGLAIKMVFLQILSVNIQLWYNASFLKLPFKNFLSHQLTVIMVFSSLAMLFLFFTEKFFYNFNFILQFIISGVGYTLIVLILILKRPELFSLDRKDVLSLFNFVKNKLANGQGSKEGKDYSYGIS